MFSLIWVWIDGWVNNREAGDLRRNHGRYDIIVMKHSDIGRRPLDSKSNFWVSYIIAQNSGVVTFCYNVSKYSTGISATLWESILYGDNASWK